MPCRCCGASRPSKGLNQTREEKEINIVLKAAAEMILEKEKGQ